MRVREAVPAIAEASQPALLCKVELSRRWRPRYRSPAAPSGSISPLIPSINLLVPASCQEPSCRLKHSQETLAGAHGQYLAVPEVSGV